MYVSRGGCPAGLECAMCGRTYPKEDERWEMGEAVLVPPHDNAISYHLCPDCIGRVRDYIEWFKKPSQKKYEMSDKNYTV